MTTSTPNGPRRLVADVLRAEDCTRGETLLGVQLTEQGLTVPRFAILSTSRSYASTVAAAQSRRYYPKDFFGDCKVRMKTMTT